MLKILGHHVAAARRSALVVVVCLLLFPQPAPGQDGPAKDAPPVDPRAALVEILRDDASREALIAELERLAQGDEADLGEPAPQPLSMTRRIATASQEAVQSLAAGTSSAWAALRNAPAALDAIGAREIEVIAGALRDLVLVIVSTVIAFLVLRGGARLAYVRMGRRAHRSTAAGRWLLFLASGLIDAAVVVLAWAIGYALAATVIGQFGEIAIRQSLYLNAFLAVEMVKVAVRLVISPSAGELRPLAISDIGARRLYRAFNIAISVVGYGLLLLVPIVNVNASFAAGTGVAMGIIILVVFYLAGSAVRHRRPVADWLLAQGRTPVPPTAAPPGDAAGVGDPGAEADPERDRLVVEDTPGDGPRIAVERRRSLYAVLARRWHLFALLWLGFVLLTALARPVSDVLAVLRASGLIAVAAVVSVALSGGISRAIGRGVSLPAHVNERLPRLELRLNGFVPQMLTALRIVLLLALAVFAVTVAGVFDVWAWLTTPGGLTFIGAIVAVFAILLVAFGLWLALTSWVEYRLNPDFGTVPTAREQTLLTLLRNALTIALVIITLMFVLSQIGLDIGPLLASAGVLGLAIGFGAQKMVQDVITGVFIQLENAMNVGDVVTAGAVTGVVEKLTIRSVSLRDVQGIYHLIPFSSVDAVSNYTRDFSHYLVDMGVAYREDIDEVRTAMFDAYDELRADPEQGAFLMGDLEWFGLNQFADSAVILRARLKTLPGKQWGVGRAYNAILKRIFDERGIEIPFPHTTLYFGESKTGETQPIRIARQDRDGD